MLGVLAHGRELQGQRLLVVGGDAGIEADARAGLPLAKNPPSASLGKPLFLRGFGHAVTLWLKTIVSGRGPGKRRNRGKTRGQLGPIDEGFLARGEST